jgi:hypothetical protein
MLAMEQFQPLIGAEHALFDLNREIRAFVRRYDPPVVGALLLTCADEAEHECADAFHRGVAHELLPRRKYGSRSPFRLANLGGQYQWGAIRIAERHFATRESEDAFKVLVVKVNAHVSVDPAGTGTVFGKLERYGIESLYCGALHAMLDGEEGPFLDELRSAFGFEGLDRVAILNDPERVDPRYRALFAAIASSRLQARHVVLDIQDDRPRTPTVYLVLPCVTLNRHGFDTEILCGVYVLDPRTGGVREEYRGLGDDPSRYRLDTGSGPIAVSDGEPIVPRTARDHRRLVRSVWLASRPVAPLPDPRIEEIHRQVSLGRHLEGPYARTALRLLLEACALVTPIATAITLFWEGVVGIHHVHRAHRLARSLENHDAATRIVREVQEKVDALPEHRARAVVEALVDPGNGIVPAERA